MLTAIRIKLWQALLLLVVITGVGISFFVSADGEDSAADIPDDIKALMSRPQDSLTPHEKWGLDIYLQNHDKKTAPLLEQVGFAAKEEDWQTAARCLEDVVQSSPESSLAPLGFYAKAATYWDRIGSRADADATRRAAIRRGERMLSDNSSCQWIPFCVVSLVQFYLGLDSPTSEELIRCDDLVLRLSEYQKGGKLEIPDYDTQLYKCQLLNRQGKSVEALTCANSALNLTSKQFPRDRVLYERAVANKALGHKNEAIADFQESLDLLMRQTDDLPAQFRATKIVRKLTELGAPPMFTTEKGLVKVCLRLWSMRHVDSLRSIWIKVSDANWKSIRQTLTNRPLSGKISEVVVESSNGSSSRVKAVITVSEDGRRVAKTVTFKLVRSGKGFLVSSITRPRL